MDSLHRGNKEKFKKRVQELAKRKLMEPKKYEDARKKYPLSHFKKERMSDKG